MNQQVNHMSEGFLKPNKGYKVLVQCYTFNQKDYITDALTGFAMQQTSFPYVCCVVDDASKDGEQDIISLFLEQECDMINCMHYDNENAHIIIASHKTNHNCDIVVFFLKENHYSLKKRKDIYIKPWRDHCEYIALCEGDDYWIDSLKLQKQVAFMEEHSECTMVCNRTKFYSQKKQRYIAEYYCRKDNGFLNLKDVVYRQGLYISTCSILHKANIKDSYPVYCRNCIIGDYPLQIYAAVTGGIYYFDTAMSVYRVENDQSWMGQQKSLRGSINPKRINVMDSTIEMLEGFLNEYPQFKDIFQNKISEFINKGVPNWRHPRKEVREYIKHFDNYIFKYKLFWKFDLMIRKSRIPGLKHLYVKLFMKRFSLLQKNID